MGLTVYLFDTHKKLRTVIARGISVLIHDEENYTLNAEFPAQYSPENGEYIGFMCVDERFRLFEIDDIRISDDRQHAAITATDAAVAELVGTIVEEFVEEDFTAEEGAKSVLAGTVFSIGTVTAGTDETGEAEQYFQTAWKNLRLIEEKCSCFCVPYYVFENSEITDRRVDILAQAGVNRGRLIQSGWDAEELEISKSGSPRPMVYGLGAADENGKPLTFADIEWSVENGDPVDKPKGQSWIGVPEAVARYPGRAQTYELSGLKDARKLIRYTWKKAQKAAKPTINVQARVSDMELAAGQTWKALRRFDTISARTKSGEVIERQIIKIDRNYVYPGDTDVTLGEFGDQEPDISRDIARLQSAGISTARRAGSAGSKAASNYLLLKAEEVRVDELSTQISTVFVELDAVNTTLTLKAELTDLNNAVGRITAAEIRLDGAEANILLKADATTVDALGTRVSSAEIELDGLNSEITLRATKVYVDAEITEVKDLVATKITAEELEARISDVNIAISEAVSTDQITVHTLATLASTITGSLSTGSIKLNGSDVSTTTVPVVTSFTQASGATASTKNVTFLHTGTVSAATAHQPLEGVTKTFE